MRRRPIYLTFACRGFALAVPVGVVLTYYAYLVHVGSAADAGVAARSNASIARCVDVERRAGRDGRACVGRFSGPCRERADMRAHAEQIECLEREYVLWDQVRRREFLKIDKALATEAQKLKFKESQSLWLKLRNVDCRLPYHFFKGEGVEEIGLNCSIAMTSARALALRMWRERLAP